MNVRVDIRESGQKYHDVYLFNSDRPFHHYASGQLVLGEEEASKLFELGDAYELLICAGGQCRVSWEQQERVLKRGSCLLVAPHTRLELVGSSPQLPVTGFSFFLRIVKNGLPTSTLRMQSVTVTIWDDWQIT